MAQIPSSTNRTVTYASAGVDVEAATAPSSS